MLPTGGRASDVSFVASNSMFHDPELAGWNVMGSSPPPNKVSPCTSLSLLPNWAATTGVLTVCLLVMMHERSSNAFVLVRPLMDRAHEYDRLDEAFPPTPAHPHRRLPEKTQPKSARRYFYPAKVP